MSSFVLHDNAYIDASYNSAYNFGTGPFSIEAWVHSTAYGPLVTRKPTEGGQGNGGFVLDLNRDGTITFATDDGSGYALINSEKTDIVNGLWHHIAAVRDGAKGYIYVDGKEIATTGAGSKRPPLNVDNNIRLLIGAVDQRQQPYQQFSGCLSEIRIWNIARSRNDILATLERRLTGSEDGLVGYWPGDLGIALDFSPTRNTVRTTGVMMTTSAPPLTVPSGELVTLLFAGKYQCATKWGGTRGIWHDSSLVYLTDTNYFVIGDSVVRNPNIQGNTISWDWEGNSSRGSITFSLDSTSRYFWPDGDVTDSIFQGWTQFDPSRTKLDYRGRMIPPLSPCSFIQSAQNGLIVDAGAATTGTNLTIQKMSPDNHQHFCISEDGKIIHMLSQLAVTVSSIPPKDGTPLVLKPPVLEYQAQIWKFRDDGHIESSLNSSLVMSIQNSGTGAKVVLMTKQDRGPSTTQLWYALHGRQYIFNESGSSLVLDGGDSDTPGTNAICSAQKNTYDAGQLWYFAGSCIICDKNGMALTIKGGRAAAGTEVVMEPMNPQNSNQAWEMDGRRIKYNHGNYVLDVSNGKIVISSPDSSRTSQKWGLLDPDADSRRSTLSSYSLPSDVSETASLPSNVHETARHRRDSDVHETARHRRDSDDHETARHRRDSDVHERARHRRDSDDHETARHRRDSDDHETARHRRDSDVHETARDQRASDVRETVTYQLASRDTTTQYEVTMITSNSWLAGTDNAVKIKLISDDEDTDLVELTNSTTHSNPFERGQTDKFIVELKSIGVLQAMFISYGGGFVFGTERWLLAGVRVCDPNLGVVYSKDFGKDYNVPYNGIVEFDRKQRITGDKIAVCKYPAQHYETRWDHTYAYLQSSQHGTIYFDAAGGHEGSPLVSDILVSKATVEAAVKMTTGHNIDKEHPLKNEYGYSDVTGKETCGIHASGRLQWDGQCHNIINRLMYVATPAKTFDDIWEDADKLPRGYGLLRLAFGPYGLRFEDWCTKNGFPPPINEGLQLYGYVQRYGTAARNNINKIIYFATALRNGVKNNPDSKPDGEEVKEFVKSVHNSGVDNTTLSKMTNLTEEEIEHLEL